MNLIPYIQEKLKNHYEALLFSTDQNLDAAKDKYDEEAALKKKGAMTKTGDSYTERLLNRLNPENPAHRDALEALAKITGPDGKVNLDNVPPEEAEAALKKLALADANLNPNNQLFPLMAGQSYKDGDSAFKFLDTMKNDFKNMFTLPSSGTLTGSAGMVDENGFFHPRTCFTAGTKIRVLKKSVASKVKRPEDIPVTKEFEELANIEDVRAGDYVLSWNEKSKKTGYAKVLNTFMRKTDLIYTLKSGKDSLETTWNHPFWVMKADTDKISHSGYSASLVSAMQVSEPSEREGHWVQAKDIRAGDTVMKSDGTLLKIESIKSNKRTETVYNFEVAGNHTYFVGEEGVLVHNECGGYPAVKIGPPFIEGLGQQISNFSAGLGFKTNDEVENDIRQKKDKLAKILKNKAKDYPDSSSQYSSKYPRDFNIKVDENHKNIIGDPEDTESSITYGWDSPTYGKFHDGMDVFLRNGVQRKSKNARANAFMSGEVIESGFVKGKGNSVTMLTDSVGKLGRFQLKYAHNTSITVSNGRVSAGQEISKVGGTAYSSNKDTYDPHVHFEVEYHPANNMGKHLDLSGIPPKMVNANWNKTIYLIDGAYFMNNLSRREK